MTLAKAVVTGIIYKNPEKRYTSNNVPVTSVVLNIGDKEELLIRVLSKRAALDEIVSNLKKDDKIIVEGRLEIATVKTETGSERRIYEIDASTIEKFGVASAVEISTNDEIVAFGEEEFTEELIGEDEIPF